MLTIASTMARSQHWWSMGPYLDVTSVTVGETRGSTANSLPIAPASIIQLGVHEMRRSEMRSQVHARVFFSQEFVLS